MRETPSRTVPVISAMMLVSAASIGAETVTLQQGIDGYAGCTAKVVLGEGRQPIKGVFPLRGSKNRLQLRFELPAALAGKELARARLGVFLPAAAKCNFFTEIFCHGVTADDGGIDEKTDFDNGRRAGAVDSVELFAPPHPGWQNFPWLFLGVPEGGAWIEFNVTPLVAKWLAVPKANRGVALVPTDCPDKKSPSTWEIDIPLADYEAKPDLRPKLTLEFGPLEKPYLVGMTNGMVQVLDRSTRFAYRGGYATEYKLSMAANELEGFQVVVYPVLADMPNVRFTWTDLKNADGKAIPASAVECFVEDWYKLRATRETDNVMYAGKLYEVPDPLIPAKPMAVRRQMHTPFYFRVRAHPDTPAGVYKGTITLAADNAKTTELKLEVKVWPYKIPEQWNFHTMGQFIQSTCEKFHGGEWGPELRRKYDDYLMENRFSPTEQYSKGLSPRPDLEGLLKRGLNTVYLSGNFTGTDAELAQLKADCEKVRQLGALDYALVYIGDETDKWEQMQRLADLVHAHLPGAMVMIGGSKPRTELIGYVDIYDPLISSASKVYGFTEKDAGEIKASQQRGEEFYWYVCVAPSYPYPNVMLEYPPVLGRVLFWMTWKYGVTGFEYYCYNIWNDRNFNSDPAKRYPNVKWQADGFERGKPTNGDGMIFYPGPTTCLRMEAMRDGIEEWESHQLLRDCVEGLRNRKHPEKYKALIAKAEKLLAVRDEIVSSFTQYATDPDQLLAAREELGDLLAKAVPMVQETEKWDTGAMRLARSTEVRVARQTALRRKMLRERHLAACEKLKVAPLAQEKWDALWPKRVLFRQDFSGPAGGAYDWDGDVVTDNVPPGIKHALLGHARDKSFARRIRVGMYFDNARATTHTWVKFKYFINEPVPIGVFVFDMNKQDNFRFSIAEPVVGKWTESTIKVASPGGKGIQPGDALDDVFIHAGKAGDAKLKLYAADVQLLGLD